MNAFNQWEEAFFSSAGDRVSTANQNGVKCGLKTVDIAPKKGQIRWSG